MTKYVAIREGVYAVVDELYNLRSDDEIVAEVMKDGERVRPRDLQVNPAGLWWPDNLFKRQPVALDEFLKEV